MECEAYVHQYEIGSRYQRGVPVDQLHDEVFLVDDRGPGKVKL